MRPVIRGPVPSTSLLRFLRSQTCTPSFFCPTIPDLPTSPSQCEAQNASSIARRRPPRRPLSTSRPRRAQALAAETLQASLFDLENVTTRLHRQPRRDVAGTGAGAGAGAGAGTGTGTSASSSPSPGFFSTAGARWDRKTEGQGKKGDGCDGDSSMSWMEKLWGSTARKGARPLRPTDLPFHDEMMGAHPGNSMFNSRRILTAKSASEPRLRCTEVDENGEVILVDGEFKKTELIAKYGLLPRDLRKIDSSNLPHILVRPSAILLNLLHLKVLIKKDRVLLFDIYGSKTSYPQSAFMYDLQGKLKQRTGHGLGSGLPYEFRALEAVLTSVTSELEADFEAVRDPVIRILSELEDDIDRNKLRILLILSKRVSTFEQKAKLVRDAIEELLEADDDLSAMYLTEKMHDVHRDVDDHTEVELLLESYNKLCDEIVQEAQNLVSSIRNTEEIIRAILDANRNSLMLLDLKFSIGTLGLAMGTFLAGLYGMNLENFIEETNWGMGVVTGVSVVMSLFVCWYGLTRLRKLQRVKMMHDERGTSVGAVGQPHWFRDDGAVGLLQASNREKFRRISVQKTTKTPRKWF